jgi:hypothetical protein
VAASAHADEASATARAETLFQKGVTALDAGDYASACPAFEESYKLSPALGTAFDLGICAEHAGRKADALRRFRGVLKVASEAGRKKTAQDARTHIATLEPQVGRIHLTVGADARGQASIDGRPSVDPDDELVDPGDHDVEWRADRRAPFKTNVHVNAGETRDVAIPADTNAVPPPPQTERAHEQPQAEPHTGPWKAIGIGAGVAGIVGVGVGTAFGIAAMGSKNTAKNLCGGNDHAQSCQVQSPSDVEPAKSAWNDAKSNATVSTVGFIAGAVLLVGGAVIYFAAPSAADSVARRAGLRIDPRGSGELQVTW